MAETIFYQDQNVVVSNSRLIVGNSTYPLSNITSVSSTRKEDSNVLPAVFGLGAFAAGASGMGKLWQGIVDRNFDTFFAGLALFALCGALIFVTFRANKITGASYEVVIRTSGGDIPAYSSRDGNTVTLIIAALNEAIVFRG